MRINVIDRGGRAHLLEADEGEALVNALSFANLVEATCGGSCSCATCQVYIDPRWASALPEPVGDEQQLLPELLHTQPTSRLACQITMAASLDGICLTVAPEQ